ncbi:hypothetical protein [Xanthocytophaga flava]|uniref:hypothetical protein n=1 Tax=Xanthocytophaga flava TaxID=3048013 RepID=UPI0028D6BEEC|nr:hypothetical protein [Xanthocytophaga flavus]MDJ1472849.1 hypothetical protein [Xanthocytophaga flavus]
MSEPVKPEQEIYNFNHHYRDTLCRALGLAQVLTTGADPETITLLLQQLEQLDQKTKWLNDYADKLANRLAQVSQSEEVLRNALESIQERLKDQNK